MRDPVLILTGPPGLGKTTVASLLAGYAERGVPRVRPVFRSIHAGYVEPWQPESHGQNVTVMNIVAGAAAG
jgi:predicted ATPase